MNRLTTLCGALSIVVASLAHAQDYSFQGFATADAMNQMHAAVRDSMLEPAAPGPQARATKPGPTGSYQSNRDISARVRAQFVQFVRQTSGEQAARQIGAVLEKGDPVASWASIVRENGLRPGNLGDALTAYWVLNWVMANQSDNTRQQTQAVLAQTHRAIATTPALARLDDAGRQEMAEVLMLNFLLQHAVYINAIQRGDQDLQRRLGQAAVTRFRKEMNIDLLGLELSNAGFVARP
ncbi:MAG TPA: hypothetical protein PLG97_08225 [Alcaligenes sp.]|nr:hypothetical protein [Alcaligenes sp.]HRL27490.1 hypothetical protein [Alcaligenes sp.]